MFIQNKLQVFFLATTKDIILIIFDGFSIQNPKRCSKILESQYFPLPLWSNGNKTYP